MIKKRKIIIGGRKRKRRVVDWGISTG